MKLKKWKIAAAAACVCLLITAAYASAGGSDDPLITLSYLNTVFTDKVEKLVDDTLTQRKGELEKALEGVLAGQTGPASEGAVFSVVTLKKGQVLTGSVGCEVMLRIGTAACGSTDSVGLIDVTAGGNLTNGGALLTNHLYLVTIDPRTVTATSNTAKVLVRGPYTVK